MDYQITSTSSYKGSFTVTDNKQTVIATLDYENWYSSVATVQIESHNVVIKPRNLWWTNFDIWIAGIDRGDITFNWKGHVIIRLTTEDGRERSFLLKGKGFWEMHFELLDEQEKLLMQLKPAFKWEKMRYNYVTHMEPNELTPFDRAILLVAAGYAVNLYMTMFTATV